MEGKVFLVGLHSIGFTHKNLNEIFEGGDNYEEIYKNFNREFLLSFKISSARINEILQKRDKLDLCEIERFIDEKGVDIITKHDFLYPKSLLEISKPPFFIYVRGDISEVSNSIGIVGSRRISTYGQKSIQNIVPELINHFSIISGGALGCDTEAHKQALESGGKTLVCIGTGIDKVYPSGNKELYENIVNSGGALISIFPLGTNGSKFTFPVRNEIIVGLSKGVLVIEAQEKSGSLITARLALEHNRLLFAFPGEITKSQSSGTNNLIKSGKAKMVLESFDILDEYGLGSSKKGKVSKPSFDETIDESIFDLLLIEPMMSDDIADNLKKTIAEISFRLSMLELTGIINKNALGKYEIK